MKLATAVALLGLAMPACADQTRSFENRLKAGNEATHTTEGKAYDGSLSPAIGDAMRSCAPPNKTFIETIGKFSLVADISKSGALSEVLVWPTVPMAQCFAESLKSAKLPHPPYAPYPLTIEMTVRP